MRREISLAAVAAAMLVGLAPLVGASDGRQSRPDYRTNPNAEGGEGEPGEEGEKDLSGPIEPAVADHRLPSSLLLYPEYDNRDGVVTILTVTNVDSSPGQDVKVEFRYIDETDCSEFNRTETLTPNDTLSLIANFHNPQVERGYVYVYAKNTSGPIVWNALIGHQLVVDGLDAFDYSVNPIGFLGVGDPGGVVQPNGTPTDLDGDGNRDLDGTEYARVPDKLLVPRFLGQGGSAPLGGTVASELVLIALSGGSKFTTIVDFLIYNDNEQIFSAEHEFYCWDKTALLDISGIFGNDFLQQFTNDDPNEIHGYPDLESGWFRVDGAVANSTGESIQDPAVYCVLVEHVGVHGVADLPFSIGSQDNGALLPRHILGDGDPTPVNGDNQ